MVCPKLAPLLGCSLFLTVVWYRTDVRTSTNPSSWYLSAFPERLFWPLLPYLLLVFLGLAEPWLKAPVFWFPKLLQRCQTPTLTAFPCQVYLYSLLIFLVFRNPITCPFSIFWWVCLLFSWIPTPLLHFPSLGDQTSVITLTVSLALVFHSLN